MRRSGRWRWALSLALAIWWMPSLAMADDGDEADEADEADEIEEAAQEEPDVVELNDEQMQLYNDALEALDEEPPDAATARRLLESALIAGDDANLLYLTLGRAHQLGDQCEEALEVFEDVETAPVIEGVPEEQILARLHNYRSQVETECDGVLYVTCRDGATQLASEEAPQLECDTPIEVSPGRYEVEATLEEVSTTAIVEVVGGRRGEVTIDLDLEERRRIEARNRAFEAVKAGLAEADDEQYRESVRVEIEGDLGREVTDEELYEELPEERRPVAEPTPSVEAGHLASQVSVSPAFGGYAVQTGDGFADGGIMYGGTGHVYLGYAVSDAVGLDLRLGGDYLDTYPLGFKEGDSDGEGTLHWTAMRVEGQTHLWLELFGLGGFAEFRNNSVEFPRDSATRSSVVAGPALTLASTNIYRGQRYMSFSARWGLLGDGAIDVFSLRLEHGVGYAKLGVEFGSLPGIDDSVDNIEDADFMRGGEYGMLTFGVRIPEML